MRVRSETDREILRLAVPAFLALVAEPLFLLGDAAVVGHLGTAELAGVGVAAVVLQTAVGLCIFLAYGTTAGVARRLGAGDQRGALDGIVRLQRPVHHRDSHRELAAATGDPVPLAQNRLHQAHALAPQ